MRRRQQNSKYFFLSIIFHVGIVLTLILGFDFTSPLAVIENTNKNDVISAVVLGDSPKNKILPNEPTPPPPPPIQQAKKEEPKPKPVIAPKPQPDKDVIALKALEKKKKLADQKALAEKKKRDLLTKNLLADIEKQSVKQKKIKQQQLKAQFEKKLREQAEKSLRQQLLNEEIKLKGTETRQAQGVINKYQALIQQAISEHWIVPTQANKKLKCALLIRLAPGGTVLDVQITKPSGDPSLDSSARAAVLKASPLPVPSDPALFEPFRQFELKVKPENILSNNGGLTG